MRRVLNVVSSLLGILALGALVVAVAVFFGGQRGGPEPVIQALQSPTQPPGPPTPPEPPYPPPSTPTPVPTPPGPPPTVSSYPPPQPPTATRGPYPLPPTPTPGPRPTKPPPPTPTVTPTWPVIIPSTATPTPRPAHLTAAHLLPRGVRLLADAIADVGPEGAPAAVLVYRWPVGTVPYYPNFGETDLHLRVQPLDGSSYTPQGTASDSLVTLQVTDLNGDGRRDLVVIPRWDGSLRFARSGLAAWPRILSATRIPFQGGHLASPVNNTFYFSGRHPMLHYAGPKQATVADGDGDGLWEVDVAYSLEDGADTWQVDRYRWDGQTYVHTETFTRPAAEPIAPDRYRAMIQALEPLPEFGPFGKGQLPVQKVEVRAQQIVEFDADGDGQPETLLTYLIHPLYGEPMWDNRPHGRLGLALFNTQDHLLWRSSLESLEFLQSLGVATIPLTLASNEPGLLFHRFEVAEGTGSGWDGQTTLYRWDGRAFRPVWQRATAGGGRSGFCCSGRWAETVWLEDVDDDGRAEVLSQRVATRRDISWAFRAYNYRLTYPGALAFRWEGAAYSPAYLVQGEHLQPIRPHELLGYSPRLSYPLTVDGDLTDWAQVEYMRSLEIRLGKHFGRPWPITAWDDDLFYAAVWMASGQTFTVALDADLPGDFADATLSADDVVLEITSPVEPGCAVYVHFRHPPAGIEGVRAAAAPSPYGHRCILELAIPLERLGLDGRTLVPVPGWVSGSAEPTEEREYHPRAGPVIGFAMTVDGQASSPAFRFDDPTTWNTLVFIADR